MTFREIPRSVISKTLQSSAKIETKPNTLLFKTSSKQEKCKLTHFLFTQF